MSSTPGPREPQHELLRAVAAAAEAMRTVAEVAEARAWAMPPAEKVRAMEELARVGRVRDAAHLSLVRSLSKAEAVELGGTTVAGLISWRLNVPEGRAAREVAAAAATDPDGGPLPVMGAALAAGDIDLEHVSVAVKVLERLPVGLREEHREKVDGFFAEQSRMLRPRQCTGLADDLLDHVDPDRTDRGFDPDAFVRRSLSVRTDQFGMVQVHGQLDPLAGAQLIAAVEHYSKPMPSTEAPAADGQGTVMVKDERTAPQRRADALGIIARQGLASSGVRGGEPPRILVTATEGQLAGLPGAGRATCDGTGSLSPAVLEVLKRYADVQAVLLKPSGAVLDLGRTSRCFTLAQRRAMLARDGGCVVIGCDVPFARLEGHHVHDWALGGLTNVDDGVLACDPHHLAITLGIWAVRMVDGLPQVMAPPWVDPWRRWLTNPRRAALDAASTLGQQLHLALRPPSGGEVIGGEVVGKDPPQRE